jgi:hypothetical protein
MARISKAAGLVAPNVGYATFKQWFTGLRGAVPDKVDSTLFRGQSGSTISQLKGALTFLKLIDDGFKPTADFGSLATVDPAQWATVFRPIIEAAYGGLLEGLAENATRQQLLDAFRTQGNVSGETAQKAVRFYVTAADECGIPMSPFWRNESSEGGTVRTKRRPSKRGPQDRVQEETGQPPVHSGPPAGTREYRLSTKSGEVVVWLPASMTATSWKRALSYLEEELFEFQPEGSQ